MLDSQSDATEHEGFPLVRTVDDAMRYAPTTALVGVATQGGRFPPAWRALLEECIHAGLDVENGLHEFLTEDDELTALARKRGVELRDLRKAPPGLERADRREPHARRDVDPHGRVRLRDREDDGRARARPRGEGARGPQRVHPDRPDGDRDRGLGDLRRRGRRGLHRRRRRAARARRRAPRGRGAVRRGPGLAAPSRVLRRDARADPRLGAARVRALPQGGRDGRRRRRPLSDPAALGARRPARADQPARRALRRCSQSPSTPAISTRRRPGARSRKPRRRPACRRTIRCVSGPGNSSMHWA